jgi:predicted transcriptional regulator
MADKPMPTLTIRLPDDTHQSLWELARRRSMSINKLMEELATICITEFDAETRFRALAASGSARQGLALLDWLDEVLQGKGS